MGLSKTQETAVFHTQGPMLVLAGPGSGKTTVITHHVLHLMQREKVPPSHILVISFTRASALEMKERFLKLAGISFTPATFGTFHSVFFTILKQSYKNRKFSIISEQEKRNILVRLIKEVLSPEEISEDSTDLFLQEISLRKNNIKATDEITGETAEEEENNSPAFCTKEQFDAIYSSYQESLKRNGQLDFDDILLECYHLLTAYPDILTFWQKYFTYILIDEFQDINPIQFEIIRLLALPENNLFVVGDDDQAIYGFRGASPEIMLHFKDYYPDSILHLLDTNYRCAPEIVTASIDLISKNQNRYEKDIKSGRNASTPENTPKNGILVHPSAFPDAPSNLSCISEHCFETQKEEFTFLSDSINNLHKNFMVNYKDIAILFRTQSGLELLFYMLKKNKIPYNLKGSQTSLYDHFITKDLNAYFRLSYGMGNRIDFLRIMDKPAQGFFRSDLKPEWNPEKLAFNFYEMESERKIKLESFLKKLEFLKRLPFPQAFSYLKNAFCYEKHLNAEAEKNIINCEEYLTVFNKLSEIGKESETYENWLEYLTEEKNNTKEENGVSLLTFHGSKGLEFKEVFIIDINEEITPHKKALTDEETEEERRMFYVAVTRAKEHLYLCYTEHYYNKKLAPSRFLSEYKKLNN